MAVRYRFICKTCRAEFATTNYAAWAQLARAHGRAVENGKPTRTQLPALTAHSREPIEGVAVRVYDHGEGVRR